MNWIRSWKHPFSIFASIIFSLLGLESGAAIATLAERSYPVAQTCPYGEQPKSYSRIVTQQGDPINVRSQPNGPVIGSIPSGWAIVPVKTDASGNWVKVNHHFGNFDVAFGSAPNFRIGWVAARYLKYLGKFCEKPQNQMSLLRLNLFDKHEIQIQSNWIKMGDRITRVNNSELN